MYLDAIYTFGELELNGLSVKEIFQVRPDFSLWWSSELVEKCNYLKYPEIEDAIKLLAFSKWMLGRNISSISVATQNPSLSRAIAVFCYSRSIKFTIYRACNTFRVGFLPFAALSVSFVKTLLYIPLTLVNHFAYGKQHLAAWGESKRRICFVSYLSPSHPEHVKDGKLGSYYWGLLPDTLSNMGVGSNWLHLRVPSNNLFRGARTAARVIQQISSPSYSFQTHICLDAFTDVKVLLRATSDWLRLFFKSIFFILFLNLRPWPYRYLWPLIKLQLYQQIVGLPSILSLVMLGSLENAFRKLPRQKAGFYLQENIGWERSLVYAWRAAGHGPIVAVPHSTIRFWDLRYFCDPRTFTCLDNFPLPQPDFFAINGPGMDLQCDESYCVNSRKIRLESLRYLQLNRSNSAVVSFTPLLDPRSILVLGDYDSSTVDHISIVLREAMALSDSCLNIYFKPHPLAKHARLGLNEAILEGSLASLLDRFSIVVAGPTTSAAADAYAADKLVITVVDRCRLNMSPLPLGESGCFFVANGTDLLSALSFALTSFRRANFFYNDPRIPLWTAFIKQLLL